MKQYKSAPKEMSSHSEIDKKGNLIIESKKTYANAKENRIDKVIVSKKELEAAKRLPQGNIAKFKEKFYDLCYKLKVTSKFVRTNEANHPRELSHCLRHITRAIGRLDLCKQSGDYGKKGKEKLAQVKGKKATSKLVKAKVKRIKAKRVKAVVKK